ncbi:MAG: hypothetical protein GZ091_03445 [Paludibacter sp.]|nr:hypothetical protein [Paludibacter sp.]
MKLLFSILIFFFQVSHCFSVDYSKIDKQSATVPQNLKSAEEIAGYLTKNLNNSTEKTRAIYYWISHNIRYDMEMLTSNKSVTTTQELVVDVLKRRKGVCANYAELFHTCCKSVGIESYVINGFTKFDGKLATISHAWNGVVIDGKYYFIDVTWAAGHEDNGKYIHEFNDQFFLIQPSEFIKTHMPFDPIWQFSNNPLSNKEFESNNFAKLNKPSDYNFSDSIKSLNDLNPIDKLMRETRRITKSGLTNSLVREFTAQNQQNIVTLKYNQGVELVNKSVEDFNFYILCKNKQFDGTSMKDEKILEILADSRKKLEASEKEINFLNSDSGNINRMIKDMENSIKEMKTKLAVEDVFMVKYIKTWKPFRIFMFYTLK